MKEKNERIASALSLSRSLALSLSRSSLEPTLRPIFVAQKFSSYASCSAVYETLICSIFLDISSGPSIGPRSVAAAGAILMKSRRRRGSEEEDGEMEERKAAAAACDGARQERARRIGMKKQGSIILSSPPYSLLSLFLLFSLSLFSTLCFSALCFSFYSSKYFRRLLTLFFNSKAPLSSRSWPRPPAPPRASAPARRRQKKERRRRAPAAPQGRQRRTRPQASPRARAGRQPRSPNKPCRRGVRPRLPLSLSWWGRFPAFFVFVWGEGEFSFLLRDKGERAGRERGVCRCSLRAPGRTGQKERVASLGSPSLLLSERRERRETTEGEVAKRESEQAGRGWRWQSTRAFDRCLPLSRSFLFLFSFSSSLSFESWSWLTVIRGSLLRWSLERRGGARCKRGARRSEERNEGDARQEGSKSSNLFLLDNDNDVLDTLPSRHVPFPIRAGRELSSLLFAPLSDHARAIFRVPPLHLRPEGECFACDRGS